MNMFVISRDKLYLQFIQGKLQWIVSPFTANSFPSRYAAKRYMKLVHPSETGWVVVQQ